MAVKDVSTSSPVVEARHRMGRVGGKTVDVTYQLELVQCGKSTCKCRRVGAVHGPYWYAYYRRPSTGRTVSRYVGRTFREVDDRDPV